MLVEVWTESACHHANTHLPTRPTLRSAWSSRSIGDEESASSVAGESAASLAPSSGPVVDGEGDVALQPPKIKNKKYDHREQRKTFRSHSRHLFPAIGS